MGTKKFCKTDYFDINKLRRVYSPLIASIYNFFSKYNYVYSCRHDYDDLKSQIELEFIRLCREYNPARGVDFPGYIKFHLQQRVYHYVMKAKDYRKAEAQYPQGYNNYDGDASSDFENLKELVDEAQVMLHERAEALASLDFSVLPTSKHRLLVEQVLLEKRSLESIAYYNGESLREVKARLAECCESLRKHAEVLETKEKYQEFKERTKNKDLTFEEYSKDPNSYESPKRQAVKLTRNPLRNFTRVPLNF